MDTLDAMLSGLLFGLTLSAAGSTGSFGVAAGAASGMTLASAYTKTTSAWALGTGNGSLDTGAIANSTWYHVWLIQRSDTGVVDILVSLNASSPTMPANYDRKRRIGAMKTDGSAQWVKFSQLGNKFLWANRVADVADGTSAAVTTAQLITLSVPTGVQVEAQMAIHFAYGSSTAVAVYTSPDQTDNAATGNNFDAVVTVTAQAANTPCNLRTDTSGRVRVRFSSTDPAYGIQTLGWNDTRGIV